MFSVLYTVARIWCERHWRLPSPNEQGAILLPSPADSPPFSSPPFPFGPSAPPLRQSLPPYPSCRKATLRPAYQLKMTLPSELVSKYVKRGFI